MVDSELSQEDRDIPTAKAVRDSDAEVAARFVMNDGSRIVVYDSGYVIYYKGKRVTVFPLHDITGDYLYPTVDKRKRPDMYIREEDLLSLPWYLGIILKAEDRIEQSINHSKANYIQLPMGMIQSMAESTDLDALEILLLKEQLLENAEMVKKALQYVTEAQYEVLVDYFFRNMNQFEIAEDLNITQQAVNDRYQRAIIRMRKGLGLMKKGKRDAAESEGKCSTPAEADE